MTAMTEHNTRRVLVIFNPVAGMRRRRRVRRFIAACAAGGAKVDLHETTGPDDARNVASRAAHDRYDALVAAGGDGTINEAINGIMQSEAERPPPLGILPLGTANVLAHELALPRRPERAAEVVLAGGRRHLMLGLANGRHFVLMAGVGFDAAVVAAVDSGLKRAFKQGAYVLSSLQLLFLFRFPAYRVTANGEVFEARSLIACNARHYGGPFVLAPKADLASPTFQLCLFERGGTLTAMRYGIAFLRGRLHRTRGVHFLETAEARIEGPDGEPVQGDGELVAQLPLTLAVDRKGLDVLVPEQAAVKG